LAENFQIVGLNEAYRLMADLTSQEKQKVILGILRKNANKNIKQKLEAGNKQAPSKSRKGKPFVTINDKNNPLGVISGVSGKFFHYRFIEFGTKARYTKPYKTKTTYLMGMKRKSKVKKSVIYRGIMKKSPFVMNIIESNIDNVINDFINNYGSETKKRLDRLARKKG
jgi:hypothetical protein